MTTPAQTGSDAKKYGPLIDDLLDDAFRELQHDTGPQDHEWHAQRETLAKRFKKTLAGHRKEQPAPAAVKGEWRYFKDRAGWRWRMPVNGCAGDCLTPEDSCWKPCGAMMGDFIDTLGVRMRFTETDSTGTPLPAPETAPETAAGESYSADINEAIIRLATMLGESLETGWTLDDCRTIEVIDRARTRIKELLESKQQPAESGAREWDVWVADNRTVVGTHHSVELPPPWERVRVREVPPPPAGEGQV